MKKRSLILIAATAAFVFGLPAAAEAVGAGSISNTRPDLAFFLFALGVAGLAMEAIHPGISVPGVLGATALIASFVILRDTPFHPAALFLVLVSIVAMLIGVKVPAHGVPGAIGLAGFAIGGWVLFRQPAHVSRPLIAGSTIALAGLFVIAFRAAMRAHNLPLASRAVVGAEGIVVSDLAPTGIVHANGETWTATASRRIPAGTRVRVVARHRLTVEVEEAGKPPERTDT